MSWHARKQRPAAYASQLKLGIASWYGPVKDQAAMSVHSARATPVSLSRSYARALRARQKEVRRRGQAEARAEGTSKNPEAALGPAKLNLIRWQIDLWPPTLAATARQV